MHINELQQGNIILIEDPHSSLKSNQYIPSKIINRGSDALLIETVGNGSIIGLKTFKSISDIKYYPLTKVLFNFLKFEMSINANPSALVFTLDEKFEIIECDKGFVYRKHEFINQALKYLHELQNLYFKETGKEIAIDYLPEISK